MRAVESGIRAQARAHLIDEIGDFGPRLLCSDGGVVPAQHAMPINRVNQPIMWWWGGAQTQNRDGWVGKCRQAGVLAVCWCVANGGGGAVRRRGTYLEHSTSMEATRAAKEGFFEPGCPHTGSNARLVSTGGGADASATLELEPPHG